jgi:hypothetical protein
MHDICQQTAFVPSKVKGASSAVNPMSYWTSTGIFDENGTRMPHSTAVLV